LRPRSHPASAERGIQSISGSSIMTAHPDFHAKTGAIQCEICGCTPCCSRTFCKTCREADRKAAAQRQSVRDEKRPTPEVVVEAIMVAVRARGIGALKEPANLDRLRRKCDARARAQINERIEKLFQKGILK
jgi:hypothetical protein